MPLFCNVCSVVICPDANLATHIWLVCGALVVAVWRESQSISVKLCLFSGPVFSHMESRGGENMARSIIFMSFV